MPQTQAAHVGKRPASSVNRSPHTVGSSTCGIREDLVNEPMSLNGDGDRYTQTVNGVQTRYVLDTASALTQIAGEIAPESETWYLLGMDVIGQQQDGAWSYFGADGLGSTRFVADASAALAYTADFDPYGEILTTDGLPATHLGFTGEYTDASGLLYLRARYANLSTGAFLSLDPVQGVAGGMSVRWNPYVYAGSNPVNYVDPSGEFFWAVGLGALAGAAIGGLLDLGLQVGDNLLNGRDAFECVDVGSVLRSAVEGAIFGAMGGGVGAFASRYKALSPLTRGVGAGLFDMAVGTAWDMNVHGDSFSQAFFTNSVAFGVGFGLEMRGLRNANVRSASDIIEQGGKVFADRRGVVRTSRRTDAEAAVSLHKVRTWFVDEEDVPRYQRHFSELEGSDFESPDIPDLLSREGFVGRYGNLTDNNPINSGLNAHHIPSDAYMRNLQGNHVNLEYSQRKGIAINMEVSRHQSTVSHPMGGNNQGFHLSPREVLDRDLNDLRNVYRASGLHGQWLEDAIDRIRNANKATWPGIFD